MNGRRPPRGAPPPTEVTVRRVMRTCALVHLAHRGLFGGARPLAPRTMQTLVRRILSAVEPAEAFRALVRALYVERLAGGAPSDHLVHDLYGGILERPPDAEGLRVTRAALLRGHEAAVERVCDMLRVGACEGAHEPPK